MNDILNVVVPVVILLWVLSTTMEGPTHTWPRTPGLS